MDNKQFRSWLVGYLEDKTTLNAEQVLLIKQKSESLPKDRDGNTVSTGDVLYSF